MSVWTSLKQLLVGRRQPDFTCGECSRSERCALPPHDTCIVRAAALADRTDAPPPHDRIVRALAK